MTILQPESGQADKPAAAAGICQWRTFVRGADERGIAAMAGIGLAVRWTVLQVGGRHEVLQHNLLTLGNLVELVEIDECKRRQPEVQVVLTLEVDAVVVVLTLFPGQQRPAEGGLAATLPSN